MFELTYLPHKAVGEGTNHNEPIGRKCEIHSVKFIWFESQRISFSVALDFS